MRFFALADVHLSFGVPNKEMDVFGPRWAHHHKQIEEHWKEVIAPTDVVLMAGDISWALYLEDVIPDLAWLDKLPGIKVLIRGNHDLWWKSLSKVQSILPPSIQVIQNNSLLIGDVAIGGTRLWDHPDFDYTSYIEFQKPPSGIHVHMKEESWDQEKHDQKIFQSEMHRLKLSLDSMDKSAKVKIIMLHYPPAGPHNRKTEVTLLLHKYNINLCVYGHMHNLHRDAPVNFVYEKTKYIFTAADFLHFRPILVWP